MNKNSVFKDVYYLFIFVSVATFSASSYSASEQDEALLWATRLADSILIQHPEAWRMRKSDGEYRWSYTQGLVLYGFLAVNSLQPKAGYESYVQNYLDHYIDKDGSIRTYQLDEFNIDSVKPGKLLFHFYEKTNDPRYLTALQTLREQLDWHPRTHSGVFWHKLKYPWQIWLDGLYMGAPFYAQYEAQFNRSKKMQDVVHQFSESHQVLLDKKTGLLFHGYDESRIQRWSDLQTGRSPGFWSRSLGWYAMALVDTLDYIDNKKQRAKLIKIMQPLFAAIASYQDEETGLWYQVPDRAGEEGNYLESSASAMFIYSFAKAARLGLVDKQYRDSASRAFSGLQKHLLAYNSENGQVTVKQVCRSAGLGGDPYRDGSYRYYVYEAEKVENDAHGIGAVLLALAELARK